MKSSNDMDFDLEQFFDNNKPAQPKVHVGGSVCESCEG